MGILHPTHWEYSIQPPQITTHKAKGQPEKQHPHKLVSTHASMICPKAFLGNEDHPHPRLAAKAIEIRWILPAVESILRPWTARNAIVAWMHRLVLLSSKMDAIVFGNKTFVLNAQERMTLKGFIFEFNQCLTRLARHFHSGGHPYFNYTSKNHYLCHMGVDASKSGISPRLGFCFQGEDFMKIVKALTAGSSRGVDSALLVNKMYV